MNTFHFHLSFGSSTRALKTLKPASPMAFSPTLYTTTITPLPSLSLPHASPSLSVSVPYSTAHSCTRPRATPSGYLSVIPRAVVEEEEYRKVRAEITDMILVPEVAFTGDTTSDFILDPRNSDALRAKVLITEATFLDEENDVEHAKKHGHMHISEIMEHAKWLRNEQVSSLYIWYQMEAATLRFGSTCSLNQKKAFQFSQKLLKSRLPFPPNCLIQKENLNSNKIYAARPSQVNRRIVKVRCSSLEPKDTSRGVNLGTDIRRKKLAIFVSGGGSNFRSIHEASIQGLIHGDVTVLVTDKPGCGGAEYARNNGIPVIVFPKSKSAPDGLSTEELLIILRNFEIDFVLLAGYLKLIPVELVQVYPKSVLNIHPSLLPAFGGKGYYGLKVHKAVIASGARYSGPTVHFVDEHYDTGRTLAQRIVPVLASDTPEVLSARVLHEEHQVYVEAVAALCEDRIFWREDGVPLIRSRSNPDEFR